MLVFQYALHQSTQFLNGEPAFHEVAVAVSPA
jgi:hypothetical protein